MPIDIDQLSESELIDLNHRIVARLRFLREMQAHSSMLEFRIGERVKFHPEGHATASGVITRYNKKTVSILTDDGHRWTVAPQLLERAGGKRAMGAGSGQVIPLPAPDRHSK